MQDDTNHISVMAQEVTEYLHVQPGKWYVDATFGRGGHTQSILNQGGLVIAFDMDQDAIEFGQSAFAESISKGQLILLRSNFDQLLTQVQALKIDSIQGILFDFGTSTNQLMSDSRGFSFNSASPLDMRMDMRLGVTALDLLNVLPEKQLADLFKDMGGEWEAKSVAKAIKRKQAMQQGLLKINAQELAEVITRAKRDKRSKLHPATKVFQALRIAVNQELDNISQVLPQARQVLSKGGRIITIAFHEGEDRLVKKTFRAWAQAQQGSEVIRLQPSDAELAQNPRARSAQMRVFEV